MNNKLLFSREAYDNLEKKLRGLKSQRKEISARLKEAMSFGDLSENAEYDEARNAQMNLEKEITRLEEQLSNAEIVDEDDFIGGVNIGCKVELQTLDDMQIMEFLIVTTTEAKADEFKISNMSPLGEAILHKNEGDIVSVKSPNGVYEVKILKITTPAKN